MILVTNDTFKSNLKENAGFRCKNLYSIKLTHDWEHTQNTLAKKLQWRKGGSAFLVTMKFLILKCFFMGDTVVLEIWLLMC